VPRRDPRQAQVRRRGNRLQVTAPSTQAIADLAVTSVSGPGIEALEIRIDMWNRPKGWLGNASVPGIIGSSLSPDGKGARLALTFAAPIDPALALAGALRMLRPHATGDRGPRITFDAGLSSSAASLAGSLFDVTSTAPATTHLRRCDTLVIGATDPGLERSSTITVRDSGRWTIDGVDHEVVVDPAVHRPLGRRSDAESVIADASAQGDVLVVKGAGLDLRIDGDLTEADVSALRAVRGLKVSGELPHRWGAQLAACGIVIDGAGFPPRDEHLAWLTRSVEASRHALRAHTAIAAMDAWPTVSAVLVTHRNDHIDAIVRQLARLSYPRLQIVIGRHGEAFDPAALAPLANHDLVVVDLDADLPFGTAMQMACARADGTLLTKMDDDDLYAPDHIWDLVLARVTSGAQLVGKALDWIYVESERTTSFRPVYAAEKYATFVAGGTLLISAGDLAAIGGWAPVPKSIDRALIERVQAHGGLVYRTHGLGYVYVRHGEGHTALVDDRHFLTKAAATWPGLVRHHSLGTDLDASGAAS
jgi:hypothetical protein